MANTLFLRLEGPLQSWGERAHWSVRDTAQEPTKSGVVGLLGCSLGLASDVDLRELSRNIRLGVRCDLPGTILVDYHTVSGGVVSAEGKIKINPNTKTPETVVSWRYYLSGASFLAAVQASVSTIASLENALQKPVWPFYLGRKSCPPSRPVFEGTGNYPDLKSALAAWPLSLPGEGSPLIVRVVLESEQGVGARRRDEVGANRQRIFAPRYTEDMLLELSNQPEEV